jgi:hypothetical protein
LANKSKGRYSRRQKTRLSRAATGIGLSSALVLSTALPSIEKFWNLTLPAALVLTIWSSMQASNWLARQLNKYTHKDNSPMLSFGTKAMYSTKISTGDSVEWAMIKVVRLSCYDLGCTVSYLVGSAPSVFVQWINLTTW